jgi:hypothetical protein
MNIINIKLVICRQDYDNAQNEGSVITSEHINLEADDVVDINSIVLEQFKNDPYEMEIYDVNEINKTTTWYFLKPIVSTNNYFAQVIVDIT